MGLGELGENCELLCCRLRAFLGVAVTTAQFGSRLRLVFHQFSPSSHFVDSEQPRVSLGVVSFGEFGRVGATIRVRRPVAKGLREP